LSLCVARLLAVAAVLGAQAIPLAGAQQPLQVPLRILVGFGAGGSTDALARLLAPRLAEALHRPVVIENRAGAGGRIAAVELKGASADGSVLMLAPFVVPVLAPLVDRKPTYDPAQDFAPVSQLATYHFALAVTADHPARDMAELAASTRADASRAFFGTVAPGSLPHFIGFEFGRATGVAMTHVPYPGIAPLAADMLGGRLPVGIDALSNLIELHRSGKLRILGVSGRERSSQLPGVPTFTQQGFAMIEGVGWFGVFAPARMPSARIGQMAEVLLSILGTPEVRERLVAMGLEPTGTTPNELAAIMARDSARWKPIIEASGFVEP
jgi:tripartite-type tricarboxylate transporter receptor subunit TctC